MPPRCLGPGRRPVELIVVVQDEVRSWRHPARHVYLYGEWLRAEYERGVVPGPETDPDLTPLLTMVLRADAPLLGPPPARLLDPVPPAGLRRAIVEGVPRLMAEPEPDTRNVLLTLARVWSTLVTGDIRPKDAAADRVLPRLPAEHRAVLRRARAVYLGERDEGWARTCGAGYGPVPSSWSGRSAPPTPAPRRALPSDAYGRAS
ncbi:aminoglycoside adenylyltransferase domain-containing protein [Streptomyces sp. HMX87]|uniref:aminoglycoside adenylyltransferase domain-containing protein n=1 Tax=Streptomyces sp. HMX87 TaxID=3390849 RepID=UPI003A878A91